MCQKPKRFVVFLLSLGSKGGSNASKTYVFCTPQRIACAWCITRLPWPPLVAFKASSCPGTCDALATGLVQIVLGYLTV